MSLITDALTLASLSQLSTKNCEEHTEPNYPPLKNNQNEKFASPIRNCSKEKHTKMAFLWECVHLWLYISPFCLHMCCSCGTLLFYSQIINYFHSFAAGHSQITFELYYFFSFCVLCTVTWLFSFMNNSRPCYTMNIHVFFIYLHTHAQTHTR